MGYPAEHTITLRDVAQTSVDGSDGTVTIYCGDDFYVLEFASPRHALDLIGCIADAQGWMLDTEERRMEEETAPKFDLTGVGW